MPIRSGYSPAQIALHWAVAVLVLFNYIYSDGMGRALDARLAGAPATDLGINPQIHVWVGIAVLVLTLIRLAMRFGAGAPPAGGAGLIQLAATWGHRLLYALLIAVPVLGGLTWFGRIEAMGDIHAVLANALLILAAGHTTMAFYHHYVIRDGLLQRMIRPGK